jgi:predicted aspartyl protease
MKRTKWLFLPLMLLAGCAGPVQKPAQQACKIEKVAEVPISFDQGFLSAPATINSQSVTMMVDTGAERTMVTPGAVMALNLERDAHAQTTIHGTGGTITTQNARLGSFGIGGMQVMDRSYAVGELPSMGRFGTAASGLIGADWLSDFDVDLDVPNRRMALYKVEGCDGNYVPWQGEHSVVTTYRYGRGLILVKLTLNGTPALAILDSGAENSLVAVQAATRAGVSPAALQSDRTGHTKGVDGAVQTMHAHRFDSMDVGSDRVQNATLAVGSLVAPMGAEMLLGIDWLRTHRVWIDYRDRRLFIQRSTPVG